MRLLDAPRWPSSALVYLAMMVAGAAFCRLAWGRAEFMRDIPAEVLSVSDAGDGKVNLEARLLEATEMHYARGRRGKGHMTVRVVAACSSDQAERLQPGGRITLGWHYWCPTGRPDGEGGHGCGSEVWFVGGLPADETRQYEVPRQENLHVPSPPLPRPARPAGPPRPPIAVRSRVWKLIEEACDYRVTPEGLRRIHAALVGEGLDGVRVLRADLAKTEASLARADQWEKDAEEWWDQARADKVAIIRRLGQRRRAALLDLVAACEAAAASHATSAP